jgi:hypothetical protein
MWGLMRSDIIGSISFITPAGRATPINVTFVELPAGSSSKLIRASCIPRGTE